MDNIEQQANLYVGQQSVDYGDSNERAEQQIKEAFIAGARGYLGTLNPNNLGEKKVFKPTTVEDLSCEKLENPFLHEQPFAQEDLERDLGLLYPPQPDKPFTPHEPTIDEMIGCVEVTMKLLDQKYLSTRNGDTCLRAVVKTLMKIRSFTINQNIGIDLEKVLADVVNNYGNSPNYLKTLDEAKSALAMVRAFKPARDVAEAHQAGKNILDSKEMDKHFAQEELISRVAKHYIESVGKGPSSFARMILYAIEEMAKLKSQSV